MAGEILKQRREELGLTVQEIAEALKIRADYLSFIEDDNFGKLPVPVYTVGYIRSYARHLNVDSDPIVQFYNQHLSQPESATIMPVAFSRKKSPRIYSVAAVLLIAGIAFFFLSRMWKFESPPSVVKAPSTAQSPKEQMTRNTQPAAVAEDRHLQPRNHDLEISAEETTWLAIIFKDGRREEALLRPGGTKSWKFPDTATLKIGNAGGIRIQCDGRDLGTPGDPGEVMTLSLPENKIVGQPTFP